MANVAIYDLATKRILKYLRSVHTPNYANRDDVLINPALPDCSMKYWKVESGIIVEMTQPEKDVVDAEEQAEQDAMEEARKDIDKLEKGLKVLAILTFKEINKLRANAGLFEYTWTQFKQAFKNEWEASGTNG